MIIVKLVIKIFINILVLNVWLGCGYGFVCKLENEIICVIRFRNGKENEKKNIF